MAQIKKSEIKTKSYQTFIVRFYWLIIIIVLIAAFSAEYFAIIGPKLKQTKDSGPLDFQSRQLIFAEQKAYLEKLKALKKEADEINRAELEKVNYVLAQKVDVPGILKQIYTLVQQPQFNLRNFSYQYGQGVLTLNFDFEGGTYQDVKAFLDEIEKNIRVMDVTNLSVKKVGNDFSLTLKSYYLE